MTENSSVPALKDVDFNRLLKSRDYVLLKFWAPWCEPCKVLAPIFEQAAARHDEIAFAQVNVEDEPAMGARLGIRSLPTIQGWCRGNQVFSTAGLVSPRELDDLIERLLKE